MSSCGNESAESQDFADTFNELRPVEWFLEEVQIRHGQPVIFTAFGAGIERDEQHTKERPPMNLDGVASRISIWDAVPFA